MPEPTTEQLDQLLALQATDSRRRRLERQLQALPEQQQLEAAEAMAGSLGQELDEVTVALDRARAEQRQLEREVDVLSQRRDAERARLYDGTVTNQREMRSVEAEIETTIRRLDEHEELLLTTLERVEELEGQAGQLTAGRTAAAERATDFAAARDAAAADIVAELAALEEQRITQCAALPAELVARYEAVAARAGGMAVGRLEGNTCTACGISLSYADVGELLAGPELTSCPQCHRLLVVAP